MEETEKLENTLNGGYNGLYGEVVTEDCYKVKQLSFQPDIVFDLGANIGVFTRLCLDLFPKCFVIAVEPNPDNIKCFEKFTDSYRIMLIEGAIGDGKVFRHPSNINGAHEVYLTENSGYPLDELVHENELGANIVVPTDSVKLSELVKTYGIEGRKSVIKIDIEGNENQILFNKEELDTLVKFDYICMELHWSAINGGYTELVKQKTLEAFDYIGKTHNVTWDNIYFYATKK